MENQFLAALHSDLPVIARALDSEVRLEMLNRLGARPMNVKQLAAEMGIPQSTCVVNLQILERAKLVQTEITPGVKGGQKICRLAFREVILPLVPDTLQTGERLITVQMPVGLFVESAVESPCGLANERQLIGYYDSPASFFDPQRATAGIVWFTAGSLDYRFPMTPHGFDQIKSLTITAEVCSEYPGYNNEWPSDVTVWINGKEVGTWTSPGDMGGTRGRLTPGWWPLTDSQYGFLKSWKVDRSGTYVDGIEAGDTTLEEVFSSEMDCYHVRIGVKPDAKNRGGVNIFGRTFGNYEQDLILRIELNE